MALLSRSLGGIDVTDNLGVRPPFDYQIPVLSLAHALKTTLADLPGPVPYLLPDPAKVEKWRGRLGSDGYKIGVVWQGNPSYFRDPYRSVPLRYFAPLAALPGVRLISLQSIYGLQTSWRRSPTGCGWRLSAMRSQTTPTASRRSPG